VHFDQSPVIGKVIGRHFDDATVNGVTRSIGSERSESCHMTDRSSAGLVAVNADG
jgi:hypothetical protein